MQFMQQRFLFCLQVTLTLALLLAVALARPQFGGFQQPGFGFQQPGFGGFPIGKNRTLLLWVFVNLYMTSLVLFLSLFQTGSGSGAGAGTGNAGPGGVSASGVIHIFYCQTPEMSY
uniref:Uncharacterized protein n=1 Tax=Daphnia magna TaxID=35525 RepID=A0A0P5LE53_9CRUS